MSTFKQRVASLIEKTLNEFELIASNTPARLSEDKMVANLEKLAKTVELTATWSEAANNLESKSVDDLKAMFDE